MVTTSSKIKINPELFKKISKKPETNSINPSQLVKLKILEKNGLLDQF